MSQEKAVIGRRPRLGLLALSLELYETLAPELRADRENWIRRAVIPALEKENDVLFGKAVYSRETIRNEVRRFEAEDVDALVVVFLCYSPSQTALPALVETRLPIIIWNTQELYAVDENYGNAELFANHGVHGSHDLGNLLNRYGIPYKIFTSHLSDPDPFEAVRDVFAAQRVVTDLRSARFALMGYPFPAMGDFAADVSELVAKFGAEFGIVPVEEYITRSADAPAEQVAALADEYKTAYDVAADLTAHDLEMTARAELALRGIVADHRLQGLTYQFTALGDDSRTSTVPFVGISRMMGEGVGFGGEGDVVSTMGSWIFQQLTGAATFSEIFTTDYGGEALFFSHMGEMNAAMARRDRKIPLVARPEPITRTRDRQLALLTSLEPGEATFCALVIDYNASDNYKIIMAHGEIEDFGPLPQLCVPHFKFRPDAPVRGFLSRYVELGGPHHNAVCFGDAAAKLQAFADAAGLDIEEI
ncbi:MAG: hypothetical protein IJJ20_08035 [Thermoguttaceae bacterium]|nr:hypothetical protein [Thermoguttaceae bacterium]